MSSKWLSWDRLAWSLQPRDADVVVRARLAPNAAVLSYRGFSRMVRSAPNAPHRFEYQKVASRSPWLPMSGRYTRYGDVRELLAAPGDYDHLVEVIRVAAQSTVGIEGRVHISNLEYGLGRFALCPSGDSVGLESGSAIRSPLQGR